MWQQVLRLSGKKTGRDVRSVRRDQEMTATEHGRACYIIHSHGEDFLVDTLCYGGNGCCSCVHFASRLKPEIERLMAAREFVPGPQFKCPHLEFADAELLQLFKQQLITQFPDTDLETT